LTNRPVFAIVAVIVSVSSLAGCGGSSAAPDGAATGTGGKKDGGATDVAGTTVGTAGAGGTTGSGGGAGGATSFPDIGKPCAADADCAGGLTCITADSKTIFETEAPAHGYCSKMCAGDADCGSAGLCVGVSSETATTQVAYCFQSCTFGGMAAKCHQRTDVGCLTIDKTTSPTTDVCYPICSQDSDCPVGRKCDVATSLCADTAAAGDPLGTHCVSNLEAGTSTCAGACLPVGNGGTTVIASFCTMLCVVGSLNSCNWVPAGTALTSGGAHGVCAFSSSDAQVGDIGFCAQECDTAASCSDQTDTGLSCDTAEMSTIGHGLCTWG
jgi:hypothetical protein